MLVGKKSSNNFGINQKCKNQNLLLTEVFWKHWLRPKMRERASRRLVVLVATNCFLMYANWLHDMFGELLLLNVLTQHIPREAKPCKGEDVCVLLSCDIYEASVCVAPMTLTLMNLCRASKSMWPAMTSFWIISLSSWFEYFLDFWEEDINSCKKL